ncbi:hypothetical protein HanPI659440_Chr16g0624721 [Helianthus annuus]|nr:hypothetical protein HanPI659440_Chr16g0624721 [Helianthus annuus]
MPNEALLLKVYSELLENIRLNFWNVYVSVDSVIKDPNLPPDATIKSSFVHQLSSFKRFVLFFIEILP